MLKLGTQNISALYLGDKKIQKAYLGESLVFGGGKPSRLPEGYTEVEYIQSSGAILLNTLQPQSVFLKILIDVELLTENNTSTSRYIIYSSVSHSQGTATYYRICNVIWQNGIRGLLGEYTIGPTPQLVNSNGVPRRMLIKVDWPNKSITADGTAAVFSSAKYANSKGTIRILGHGLESGSVSAKLYSCKMEVSETPTRDFVPCVDPGGEVGLYDLVEGKFYGNERDGIFTAGPTV